jgi:hypothetical protein
LHASCSLYIGGVAPPPIEQRRDISRLMDEKQDRDETAADGSLQLLIQSADT